MNGETETTDVLIVGAGPCGLLLANLLGTMNVDTVIVERNQSTVQEPRAVSIDDESMRALQAVGLHREMQKISVAGYGSIYRGPGGSVFATVKPVTKEYGFEKRNAFQQPDLEELLRKGLKRFANVKAHFGTEAIEVSQDEKKVRAVLRTAGQKRIIQAKFLVGADGGRSGVRKSLDIEMEGKTFAEPWLIVDLKSTRNRCFHTEVFCHPKRPAITLPGPDGIRRYEFKLRTHESIETAETEQFARQLLREVGPDGEQEFRRVQVYTFHARIAERWRDGRMFLAGDAAHLTPPFAGQGMNSGLRDAHNLAWKIAVSLTASQDCEVLDSYEVERKPHAWSLIMLALRMGQVMMPTSSIQGAMVRGVFRMLGIYPPARDYIAQMKYKPKPRFERGSIEPDGRNPKETIVGQMIPQPIVADAARRRHLLDDILPRQAVIVLYTEMPEQAISDTDRAVFRDLGIAIVGLTPEWTNPQQADFPIVRDQSRFFSQPPFVGYLDHALLLRPDRYVAATRPIDRLMELTEVAGNIGTV